MLCVFTFAFFLVPAVLANAVDSSGIIYDMVTLEVDDKVIGVSSFCCFTN